ncbi:MAG: histidine kinase dimerization/phospho-acceptor domain-containing protein [Polyangiales bacterium]
MKSTHNVYAQAPLEPECEDASNVRMRARVQYKPKRDALTRVRHDLRSLVHAVTGYSDLLATPSYGALSPEQQRFVANVRTAAEQLQELVDACVELARPVGETSAMELPTVLLGSALEHVVKGLATERVTCALAIEPALSTRLIVLDVSACLGACKALASVITGDGARACVMTALREGDRVVVRLAVDGAPMDGTLTDVEALTEDLGNRDFVKLKLAETLLARQGVQLLVSRTLEAAELELHD